MKRILFILLLAFMCAPLPVSAQDTPSFRDTELPLPRFASLRSDKVYMRAGPGLRYPIRWIYNRENLPMEIVQEFDHWRKIRDYDGEEGWVHQSLLSGLRTVMVRGEGDPVPVRDKPESESRMIVRLEPTVIATAEKCIPDWCRIEVGGYRGWIEKKVLWGIYEDEELD
ncbi:MAG: hypothetical protein H6868_06635 [Rhodospirillales bacterium]|nr:hypothetical protein [Rhodospirillales bacterium]